MKTNLSQPLASPIKDNSFTFLAIGILFTFFIVIFQSQADNLKAQTSTQKLDQITLLKQYNGNWEGNVWENTSCRFSIKIMNKGGEGTFTYFTKEKELGTGKQIYYYDEKNDYILVTQLFNFTNFAFWKLKFVEPTKAICEFYNNIKLEVPVERWTMEFLPSGELRQSKISDTEKTSYTYKRVN